MRLKSTYEGQTVHDGWKEAYRHNPAQERLNDAILKKLLKHLAIPEGGTVLDAGCGPGDHLIRIAQQGYRTLGVDLSEHILRSAKATIADKQLHGSASVSCQSLVKLAFADASFNAVHCRGVLMHVPELEAAVGELCRVLKPGGRIILMESNQMALESRIVQIVRRIRSSRSDLTRTSSGLEFWSTVDGLPFLLRISDIGYLGRLLLKNKVKLVGRFATEYWDVHRIPAGAARNMVIAVNRMLFAVGAPATLSIGNALIGQKLG